MDIGSLSSFSLFECKGQGGRLTLLLECGLLAIFGTLWGCLLTAFVKSPADADLSKTLHLFGGAGLGRGQSITCLIFTYNTHEKKKPKIGMTDIPTPTAASIIKLSRMWFVNCRMQPWNC